MTGLKSLFSLEMLSGIVTWLVVAGMSLMVLITKNFDLIQIMLACALYLSYIVLWLFLVQEDNYAYEGQIRMAILVSLFAIVIGIFFVVPLSFNSILMGIICGALPYFFNIKRSFIICTLMSLPLFCVFYLYCI